MIRVIRHDNVLKIDIETGSQWIPDEFGRDPNTRLEMRILYELADYLEKQATAAQEAVAYIVTPFRTAHDGSYENGPDELCFAEDASEYVRHTGLPLYAAPVSAAPGIDLELLIEIRNRLHAMACRIGDEWEAEASELQRDAQKVIDSMSEASPKGGHCTTCTCDPNMTPAIRFDLSPAIVEGEVRNHLIALGWTPPDSPNGGIESVATLTIGEAGEEGTQPYFLDRIRETEAFGNLKPGTYQLAVCSMQPTTAGAGEN